MSHVIDLQADLELMPYLQLFNILESEVLQQGLSFLSQIWIVGARQ